MSYIDRLNQLVSENPPQTPPTKPTEPVLSVSSVSSGRRNPRSTVAAWRGKLAQLDWGKPLHGLALERWRQLNADAHWLLDEFGLRAVLDGWDEADLFGWWPGVDGAGGVAIRLRSSRRLMLTDCRAIWRHGADVSRFNRASYPDLRPFWEESRATEPSVA